MCALGMNVALTNLMMSAPTTAAPSSSDAIGRAKRSQAGESAKTGSASGIGKSGQSPKTSSPEASNEVRENKPGKSGQSPADKAPDAGKSDKPISPECPGLSPAIINGLTIEAPAFSAVLHATQASGNPLQAQSGEVAAKALAPDGTVLPQIAGAGKTRAVKDISVSLSVAPAMPGKAQVVSHVHKFVAAAQPGQGTTTSGEVVEKSVGGPHINVGEPASPLRTPPKAVDVPAEPVLSEDGAEGLGKLPVGAETASGNRQVLLSAVSSHLPVADKGTKQPGDAPRQSSPVPGIRSDFVNPGAGRKIAFAKGSEPTDIAEPTGIAKLTGVVESTDRVQVQAKLNASFKGPVQSVHPVAGSHVPHAEVVQDGTQQVGAATDAPRFDVIDTPTVPSGDSLPASATNQIVEALRASAARQGNQVVIRLNPPELGKVSITLNANGNEVHGVLKVENPNTLSQLQREAPALLVRLAEAGIQLKQMDLSLSEQGTNDSALSSQLRDESGVWHRGGQGHDPQTAASELASDEPVLAGVEEILPGAVGLTDGAINVWI